ncbi:MAG: hypothetical protein RLZZ511_647 [Cyanobacteriota bacterium]
MNEGGEGGEGGNSSGNPDVDLMTNLGLMKGHLIVAKELIDAKQYKEAVPHIGHPVEEIYGDVEPLLTTRKLAQFKPQLTQMSDLIKATPDSPEMATAYDASVSAIDQTIAAIPASQRQSPEFTIQVVGALLNTAADEYKAAIADGKFVELVEYQDSRGFVQYAETLYKAAPNPDAAKHTAISNAFTQLKTAWPAVMPPTTPVKTPEEIAALVKQIAPSDQVATHHHH